MRILTEIPIQNIQQARKPRLNLKTLKFAMLLLRGTLFPPIKVRQLRGGNYEVRDGRHRLAAHKLAGKSHIKAYVGIPQHPDQHKALVHGPTKPVIHYAERPNLERQTWLEL